MQEDDQQVIATSIAYAADLDVELVTFESCKDDSTSRRRLQGSAAGVVVTNTIIVSLTDATYEQTNDEAFITNLADTVAQTVKDKVVTAVNDGSFVSKMLSVYEEQDEANSVSPVARTFTVSSNVTVSSVDVIYAPSMSPTNPPPVDPTGLSVVGVVLISCAAALSVGLGAAAVWYYIYQGNSKSVSPTSNSSRDGNYSTLTASRSANEATL